MDMTAEIRTEAATIYQKVADVVCRPGMPRKQMDPLVSRALNGYPLWRIRACRLGEAGCFSAAAICTLQREFVAFMDRHAAQRASATATQLARQAALTRETLKKSRAEVLAQLARIEAQLARVADDGGDPA